MCMYLSEKELTIKHTDVKSYSHSIKIQMLLKYFGKRQTFQTQKLLLSTFEFAQPTNKIDVGIVYVSRYCFI